MLCPTVARLPEVGALQRIASYPILCLVSKASANKVRLTSAANQQWHASVILQQCQVAAKLPWASLGDACWRQDGATISDLQLQEASAQQELPQLQLGWLRGLERQIAGQGRFALLTFQSLQELHRCTNTPLPA